MLMIFHQPKVEPQGQFNADKGLDWTGISVIAR
jgi:hypothetical protein